MADEASGRRCEDVERSLRQHVRERFPDASARLYDADGGAAWVLVVDRGVRHFEATVDPRAFGLPWPCPKMAGVWRELEACLTRPPGPVHPSDVFTGLRVHVGGHRGIVARISPLAPDGGPSARAAIDRVDVEIALGSGADIVLVRASTSLDRQGRLFRARDGNVVVDDASLSPSELERLARLTIDGVPGLR